MKGRGRDSLVIGVVGFLLCRIGRAATLAHDPGFLSAKKETRQKPEIHSVVFDAATKAHQQIENQLASLHKELLKTQHAFETVSAEEKKAKEMLFNETHKVQIAAKRAEDLSSALKVEKKHEAEQDKKAKQILAKEVQNARSAENRVHKLETVLNVEKNNEDNAAKKAKKILQDESEKVHNALNRVEELSAALKTEKLREEEKNNEASKADAELKTLQKRSVELRKKNDEIVKQVEALRNASDVQEMRKKDEIHSLMLKAAAKVQQMEDKADTLQKELFDANRSLETVSAEDAKAKDTLLLETQTALEATRRSDGLAASLAEQRNATDSINHEVAILKSNLLHLEIERRRLDASLVNATENASQWREAAETVKHSADASHVALQQKNAKFQTLLLQAQSQATQSQAELNVYQSQKRELERFKATFQNEKTSLLAKLRDAESVKLKQAEKAKAEIHLVMLKAAEKVQQVEDRVDSMQRELNATKNSLDEVSAEDAKAKEALMQETQNAFEATQRAETLASSVVQEKKNSERIESKVANLKAVIAKQEAEKARYESAIQNSAKVAGLLQESAKELENSADEKSRLVNRSDEEKAALRQQVSELSGEHQRADTLSEDLNESRTELTVASSKIQSMKEQMQRLREIKDRYSAEAETAQRESEDLHAKFDNLQSKLEKSESAKALLEQQRDAVADRIRSARSDVDEYFEENTRLRQQNDALDVSLRDAHADSNKTVAEKKALEQKLHEIEGDLVRERTEKRSALIANQQEMEHEKQENRNNDDQQQKTLATLQSTRAVLLDWQRKVLNLPPAAHPDSFHNSPTPDSSRRSAPPTVQRLVTHPRSEGSDSASHAEGGRGKRPLSKPIPIPIPIPPTPSKVLHNESPTGSSEPSKSPRPTFYASSQAQVRRRLEGTFTTEKGKIPADLGSQLHLRSNRRPSAGDLKSQVSPPAVISKQHDLPADQSSTLQKLADYLSTPFSES